MASCQKVPKSCILPLKTRQYFFPDPGEPLDTRFTPPDDDIFDDVSILQMPWLVSLGGFLKNMTNWDHQCGGSLITNR